MVGFLGSRTGRVLPFETRRGEVLVRVSGRHAIALDDGNAYLAAGLAGLGALWLPHYMAAPYLQAGDLQPLMTDWSVEPMPLYLVYPPHRHVGARLRVFLDWVAEVTAERGNALG